MATPCQPHMDSMGMSSCHEVNGVPDPRMRVDTSALDTAFKSDVGSSLGLHLAPDNGNSRSFGQLPWNFSLSDLIADLSNLLGEGGSLAFIPQTTSRWPEGLRRDSGSNLVGLISWDGQGKVRERPREYRLGRVHHSKKARLFPDPFLF
ncbi:hypothetical protein Tco_0744565 [Tanacetum coccineum]